MALDRLRLPRATELSGFTRTLTCTLPASRPATSGSRQPVRAKAVVAVARGSVETEGDVLNAGDGAAWSDASSIRISAKQDAELLLFDMAH